MKKSLLMVLTAICIILQTFPIAVMADENDGRVSTEESAGAPPAAFGVYAAVDGYDSVLLASYTGTQMRTWAQQKNPAGTNLKYSAQSYAGTAGRVVTEYLSLADFIELVSQDAGPLCFESGDYLIMGEDFTRDEEYTDAYPIEALMFNWYSYDDLLGTERYYFPNWSSGSEEGAVEVPAVIGIKSYGDSGGMSDAALDLYALSADYLWAYVIYYGQLEWTELTYGSFYYGQDQVTINYKSSAAANETVVYLLEKEIARAGAFLENTETASASADVSQGKYWVTAGQYIALQRQLSAAQSSAEVEDATNGELYSAMLSLAQANDLFESQRKQGTKSGYFWYTNNNDSVYVITTATQLWELCQLVNGTAYDESTYVSYDQDSFEGKTVILGCDVDAEGMRPHIGDGSYSFDGTFDGCGYTIRNLQITFSTDTNYAALFGRIGENGTVKNLTVEGESGGRRITGYVGGIAAFNAGTIENCVSYVDVAADSAGYVGGIAGYNAGAVNDCAFLGTVTGCGYVGGVAGYNAGTVNGCVNAGVPSGTDCVGGVVGYNSPEGAAEYCIDTKYNLVGSNGGKLAHSYTISGYAFNASSGEVNDIYCTGDGAPADGVTVLSSAAEFCTGAVLDGLNGGTGRFKAVAAGYPALTWQAVYTVYYELMLDGNVMEESNAAEYLPAIKPEDPTAKKYENGILTEDTGYIFGGWYTDETRTELYDFSLGVSGDVTVYAGWTGMSGEPIHKITVNIEQYMLGGTETEIRTYFYPEGGEYVIENEEKEGYICQTPVLSGIVGSADAEYTVIYRRLGDMNLDGKVNAVDAMLLMQHLSGQRSLDADQLSAADVDGNGLTNSDDCIQILWISIGREVI